VFELLKRRGGESPDLFELFKQRGGGSPDLFELFKQHGGGTPASFQRKITARVPLPDDAFSIGPDGPLKKGLWSAHA
jgi:hypothetical protein